VANRWPPDISRQVLFFRATAISPRRLNRYAKSTVGSGPSGDLPGRADFQDVIHRQCDAVSGACLSEIILRFVE